MTQSRNGFAVLGLLTIALVSPIGSKTTGAQQGLDSTAANPQGYRSTTLDVALLSDDRVELAYGGMTAGRNSTQVFQLTPKAR